MAAKGPGKCGQVKGHASAVEYRNKSLEAEIKRVNDQYNGLLVDLGPRCVHTHEGPDARNVALMERHAKDNIRLNERIKELEASLAATRPARRKQGSQKPQSPRRQGGKAASAAPVPAPPAW